MPPEAESECCILVKTAPEISLKTHYVRRYFMGKLAKNMKAAFRAKGLSGNRMVKGRGRIFLYAPEAKAKKLAKVLPYIFGIHSFALAEAHKTTELNEIADFVVVFARKLIKQNNTFAIRGRVAAEKKYSSKDLEIALGSAVLESLKEKKPKVNLSNPKREIFVEVQGRETFVYAWQEKGAGGLPLGCEGTVAVLFEGKKDEALAAFLVMRRGCNVFPLVKSKTAKVLANIKKLVPWNSWRKFKPTPMRELGVLVSKPDISAKALVLADAKPRKQALSRGMPGKFDAKVPLLYPLAFYPKELKNEKMRAIAGGA
ncbi:MAG: THUMP domain-containing protein [Candidatus Diapherotrites archaeon]